MSLLTAGSWLASISDSCTQSLVFPHPLTPQAATGPSPQPPVASRLTLLPLQLSPCWPLKQHSHLGRKERIEKRLLVHYRSSGGIHVARNYEWLSPSRAAGTQPCSPVARRSLSLPKWSLRGSNQPADGEARPLTLRAGTRRQRQRGEGARRGETRSRTTEARPYLGATRAGRGFSLVLCSHANRRIDRRVQGNRADCIEDTAPAQSTSRTETERYDSLRGSAQQSQPSLLNHFKLSLYSPSQPRASSSTTKNKKTCCGLLLLL